MSAPIDYERTLRETILETLVPESEEIVGFFPEDPQLQEIGWWITIGGKPAFFGPTFKSAIFTAKSGDWFFPGRDGTLIPLLIEWFERRADIPAWEEVETQEQRNSRRERCVSNTEFTSDELIYDAPYHPEMDTGIPISNQEMHQMLENQPQSPVIPLLKEIEFLEIDERSGTWILDDDVEKMRRATLLVKDDGYTIRLHEETEVVSGMKLKTVLKLKVDAEENLISLKMYGADIKNPILVLRRHGELVKFERLALR